MPAGGRRRHAEPAVVVDLRGAEHDPGELARARTPSRWSARRRRRPRTRPGRAPYACGASPSAIAVERLVPGGRLELAAGARRTSGSVSRTREESTRGRRTALAAQRAPVDGEVRRAPPPRRPAPSGARAQVHPHCRAQYGQWVGGVGAVSGVGDHVGYHQRASRSLARTHRGTGHGAERATRLLQPLPYAGHARDRRPPGAGPAGGRCHPASPTASAGRPPGASPDPGLLGPEEVRIRLEHRVQRRLPRREHLPRPRRSTRSRRAFGVHPDPVRRRRPPPGTARPPAGCGTPG